MCLSDGTAGGGIKILGGHVCYNGTTPGAQHFAVPACMEDSLLSNVSSPYRECLSNGKWSGTVARCVRRIGGEFNAVTQYMRPTACMLHVLLSVTFLSLNVGIQYSALFSRH